MLFLLYYCNSFYRLYYLILHTDLDLPIFSVEKCGSKQEIWSFFCLLILTNVLLALKSSTRITVSEFILTNVSSDFKSSTWIFSVIVLL
jgi:hypothetical protein